MKLATLEIASGDGGGGVARPGQDTKFNSFDDNKSSCK